MKKIFVVIMCVLIPIIITWGAWVSRSTIQCATKTELSKESITGLKEDIKALATKLDNRFDSLHDKLDGVRDEILDIYKNKETD